MKFIYSYVHDVRYFPLQMRQNKFEIAMFLDHKFLRGLVSRLTHTLVPVSDSAMAHRVGEHGSEV